MRPSPPRHFCIFRTDGIGDALLTLPVAQTLRREAPGARVAMCVRDPLAELIALSPAVDEVIPVRERDVRSSSRFAEILRARNFDAAIFAFPRPGLVRAARRAGIPVRIGTANRYYSLLLTHRHPEHRREARFHEAEYNLHLLDPLGIPWSAEERPLLRIPDSLRQDARALAEAILPAGSREFLILHPGSAGSAKDWSPASFGLLAARLRDFRPDIRFVVTGTASEKALTGAVADAAPGIVPLPRELTLAELAGFISIARCIVANSTGPLHIGAAVGTPVVGLYPNKRVCNPRRWGPLAPAALVLRPPPEKGCKRCENEDCETHDRMERITVDAVFDAVRRQISGTVVSRISYTG